MTYQDQERREFLRLNFKTPLEFRAYNEKTAAGTTRNISQAGILFQTEQEPPRLSSIVWMSLDMRSLKICQEIESRALIFNNGVLGKVVRVEEDANRLNAYDVGVCFLKKGQKDSREVKQILSELSKTT